MAPILGSFDEAARLAALQKYHILNTSAEAPFDDIARLAAFCSQSPMAAISFVDAEQVWFKAVVGPLATTIPRAQSICTYTIQNNGFCLIPDTAQDPRLIDNPLVVQAPGVRFYAGVPLLTPEGYPIGTLCVMDTVPRTFSAEQQSALQALARQVTTQLELRRNVSELQHEIAQRKNAQEELYKSQQELAIFAHQSFFPMLGLDANFIITGWNLAAEKTFGFTQAEVIGRHPVGLIVAEKYADLLEEGRQQRLRDKQPSHSSSENFTRDGRTLICEWYMTPLLDSAGEVIGFTGIAQEITEAVRATAALQASEVRFRTLFQAAPLGICMVRQQKLLYVNPAVLTMFGAVSAGLHEGESILNYVAPESQLAVLERLQKYDQGEVVAGSYEMMAQRVDGSYFPVHLQTSQVLLEDGTAIVAFITDITKSKQAQKELENSLAVLQATLESTTDGILVVDLHKRILNYNQKFSEMSQAPAALLASGDEAVALADFLAYIKEPQAFLARVHAIYGQETEGSFDLLEFNDGRCYERYSQPFKLEGQRAAGRVWSFRDVSKQRQADTELRQREALLRATLESTADGILVVDLAGQIVSFNQKFSEMWRIPPTIVAGRDDDQALAFVLEQLIDPTSFLTKVRDLYSQPQAISFDELLFKDGRTFERYSQPVQVQGQSVGRVWSFRDVTIRRQAEEALRQSEALLRGIIDSTPLSIFVKTLDGRYLLVNRTWEQSNHLTLAQIQGKTNYDLFAASRADRYYAWDQQLLSAGKPIETEEHNPDGDTSYTYSCIRSLLCDEAGAPTAIIGIATDITERRRLEEQLQQAQKMEAIGRLAGGVAHDFNNILTIIYSACALARRRLGDEARVGHYLDEIQKAGERAAALIQQLLAFSRKQVVQPRVLSLHTLLTEMEGMIKRLVGESIQVKLQLASNLATIQADANQLEQVIFNLVANARDAMPNGGILLISTDNITHTHTKPPGEPQAEARTFVRLTVVDSGQGVDPAVLPHIFEPFFTTKGMGKGTGLGLATVYGIVRQNGGEIQVESKLDWGTTVKVLLPAVGDHFLITSPIVPDATATPGAETVLVVEDQEEVRRTTVEILGENGYQVLAADSAAEALRVHTAHPGVIDLLLTDVVMPVTSGSELAARLRARQPTLKVLYMSGHTEDEDVMQAVRTEQVAFLQKPFTQNELLEKLRGLLEQE